MSTHYCYYWFDVVNGRVTSCAANGSSGKNGIGSAVLIISSVVVSTWYMLLPYYVHTQLNFIEGLTVPRATLIEELNCRTHSSASVFLTYPWLTQEHVCQVWGVEGWCNTFIQAIDPCVSISCKGASDYRNQFAKSRKRSLSTAKMSYQEKLV